MKERFYHFLRPVPLVGPIFLTSSAGPTAQPRVCAELFRLTRLAQFADLRAGNSPRRGPEAKIPEILRSCIGTDQQSERYHV